MISLFRLIYRSLFVKGKPLHQILVGILLIPAGGFVAWASLAADPYHYYPYFAIVGIVFAGFGVALIIKGFIGLLGGTKPVQPQAPYGGAAQYPQQPQVPYAGQAQYPQQPQAPYGGAAQYPQQPQVPYAGQAQYSQQPQAPYGGAAQYPQQPQAPYAGQAQYPQRYQE